MLRPIAYAAAIRFGSLSSEIPVRLTHISQARFRKISLLEFEFLEGQLWGRPHAAKQNQIVDYILMALEAGKRHSWLKWPGL